MSKASTITSTPHERFIYKVPFDVIGHLSLIMALCEKGVVVKVDKAFKYACAYFDNTQDYNAFKKALSA